MASLSLIISVSIVSLLSLGLYLYGFQTKTLKGSPQSPFIWGAILWGTAAVITYLPLSIILYFNGLDGYVDFFKEIREMGFITFLLISFIAESIRYQSIIRGFRDQTVTQKLTVQVGVAWSLAEVLGRYVIPAMLPLDSTSPLRNWPYYGILIFVFLAHLAFTEIAFHVPYSSKYLLAGVFLRFFFEITYLGAVAFKPYSDALFLIGLESLLILSITLVIQLGKRDAPHPLNHDAHALKT